MINYPQKFILKFQNQGISCFCPTYRLKKKNLNMKNHVQMGQFQPFNRTQNSKNLTFISLTLSLCLSNK